MEEITREKFFQNPKLLDKLIATGNRHLSEKDTWNGKQWFPLEPDDENRHILGDILMRLRKDAQRQLNL